MYQPLKSGGCFPTGSRSHIQGFHNTPRDIGSGGRRRRSCPRWCRRCRSRIFPQCRRDRLRRPADRMRRSGRSSQRKRSCRERAQSYYPPIARGCGTIIKQIHTLVLMDRPEDRGVYRRIPVKIMGAYHTPPEPVVVPEQMEKLVKEFSKKKLHPIESAALFHLKFEGIHPFVDGNGRTGRLILNLFLMQNGYPPINVKFADRKRYYEAFDSYYRDNDAGAMVQLIAEYVEERLIRYIEITN